MWLKGLFGLPARSIVLAASAFSATADSTASLGMTEWHKITPNGKPGPDNKTWDNDDLRKNMKEQINAFPSHTSTSDDSQFRQLDKDMRDHCDVKQCSRRQDKRALLRRSLKLRLQRRALLLPLVEDLYSY